MPRPPLPPTMTAPYRAIPISAWVHEPEWGPSVSIDRPFEDGVSGWMDYTLTAKTDLLLGGERTVDADKVTHVHFYRTPDGVHAIPGASLRGMIRSVLEIGSFGRAAFIDDAQYAVRDLTRGAKAIYSSRFADDNNEDTLVDSPFKGLKFPDGTLRFPRGVPRSLPLSRAGWLRKDSKTGRWMLTPCAFSRVAVTGLDSIQGGIECDLRPPGNGIERRHQWWGCAKVSLYVEKHRFHRRVFRPYPPNGDATHYFWECLIYYSEAYASHRADCELTSGELVFTGKPAYGIHEAPRHLMSDGRQTEELVQRDFNRLNAKKYYGKKKHEFFFHTPEDSELDVTDLGRTFLAVNDAAPGRDAAESWDPGGDKKGWKAEFENGEPVPVFYLEGPDPGRPGKLKPVDIGLAMMFRLAHADTTHKLLERASPAHKRQDVLDFPALIFGPETGKRAKRKGRVSFENAVGIHGLENADPFEAVLATPKGQFFPAYVKQARRGDYASYTPIPNTTNGAVQPLEVREPELSGRKRYPSNPDPGPPPKGKPEMSTILHPLKAGAEFKGRVRFHNLKPEELGALVWALELWAPSWGGDRADLRHRLGMGKPLGRGDVRIDLKDAWIEPNRVPDDGSRPAAVRDLYELRAYADAFDAHMSKSFAAATKTAVDPNANWRTSEQIEMLLALCDPNCADPDQLKYMILNPDKGVNEFGDHKKQRHRLPDAPRRPVAAGASPGAWQDRDVFPHPFPDRPAPSIKDKDDLTESGAPRDAIAVGTDWVMATRGEHVLVTGHPRGSAKVRVRYDDGALADLDPGDLRPPPEVDAR